MKLNNCEPKSYFYDYVPHFLIFIDDASRSKIYSDGDKNPLVNFTLRYRHYNCSIICATQTFKKGITKGIRENINCWCIWRQSEDNVKMIYNEVISSVVRKRTAFYDMFDKITENDHDFILIDKHAKHKKLMIRKNFNEILNLDNYINGKIPKQKRNPFLTNTKNLLLPYSPSFSLRWCSTLWYYRHWVPNSCRS